MVERLRHGDELATRLVGPEVLRRRGGDVVDAAAHHEAQRVEPRLLHQQELVDGQIAGEKVRLLHPREALARVLRQIAGLSHRRSSALVSRPPLRLARRFLQARGVVVAVDDLAAPPPQGHHAQDQLRHLGRACGLWPGMRRTPVPNQLTSMSRSSRSQSR